MMKKVLALVFSCCLLLSTAFAQLTNYGTLHFELNECSGFDIAWNRIYAHNDSGDSSRIFELDQTGALLNYDYPEGVLNRDWEDMTISQDGGTLYLADVGSNNFFFDRPERVIYKFDIIDGQMQADPDSIVFSFEDYYHYADISYFDCEAVFYQNESIYLLTKNYYAPTGYSRLYKLNTEDKVQSAVFLDSLYTEFRVTAADGFIDEICVLTEGKVIRGQVNSSEKIEVLEEYYIPFAKYEAITYLNQNNVLLAKDTEGLGISKLQLRDDADFELQQVFVNDSGELIIQPTNELTEGLVFCKLFSVSGQLLKEGALSNCCGHYKIDITDVDDGMIVLQLETKDNISSYKIVK